MPRNILLIAPEPPPFGGMANQCLLLKECLAKEGLEVFFVPTNKAPAIISTHIWELPFFRTLGRFFIYIMGIFRSLKYCSTIHLLACSNVYFYVNVIPVVIIGKLSKKNVVVNYRGGEAESFFKGFARYFLCIFRIADSLILPSGYLQSVFHKLGLHATVVPNISEIERFNFSLPEYKDHVRFICTRNFEAYYDHITLVNAFCLVKKALPNASLTLTGEGNFTKKVMDYVKKVGLINNVAFPGRVAPIEMPAHLDQHDIYVNSSIVDNYPISLLEAFSSGLPVVSTDAGGIPFMVEHGKTGILVPAKDHKALAREMIRVAQDLDLGRKLAKNAKKFADEHSWEKIWPKLKAEYQWQD